MLVRGKWERLSLRGGVSGNNKWGKALRLVPLRQKIWTKCWDSAYFRVVWGWTERCWEGERCGEKRGDAEGGMQEEQDQCRATVGEGFLEEASWAGWQPCLRIFLQLLSVHTFEISPTLHILTAYSHIRTHMYTNALPYNLIHVNHMISLDKKYMNIFLL